MQESNMIIDNISSLNDDITSADTAIDSMSDLIFENHRYIREFDNLYEKCFYLEGSLHLNDDFTNKTSFENLFREYNFLLEKFTNKNRNYVYSSYQESEDEFKNEKDQIDHETISAPSLKNAISISNLKLKPIRCRSTKISKKKSRYRLSNAYTLNPLLNDATSSTTTTPFLPVIERDDEEVFGLAIPDPPNRQDSLHYVSSNTFTNSPDIMDSTVIYHPRSFNKSHLHPITSDVLADNDVDTVSTSPPSHAFSQVRGRSNSLPATPIAHSKSNQVETLFHFTDFHQEGEDYENRESELEKLRLNRLKHFISYDHGFTNNTHHSGISKQELQESPKFSPIPDINHLDIDSISVYSDFSYHSPEGPGNEPPTSSNQDEFENFERFLRRSRLDLNSVLPLTPIKKSNSHDSRLSSNKHRFQFHNPIATVLMAQKQNFIQPTIEAIYSNKDSSSQSQKAASSSKLLSEVISKNNDPPSIPNTPTKKSSFKIFNMLASPSNSSSKSKTSCALTEGYEDQSSKRRNSIDFIGKSLTESFKLLVNNNQPLARMTPIGPSSLPPSLMYMPKSKPSPPPKIKRLKNRNKLDPITAKNTMQNQRLPPPFELRKTRKDGYHSKLTIGPHKTKIIDHGDSSVFKKPLVSKVSHNSLREALSESFL